MFKRVSFALVIVLMLAITGGLIASIGVKVFEQQQPDTSSSDTVTETTAAPNTVEVPLQELAITVLENGYWFEQLEEPLRVQYNAILKQILTNAHRETLLGDQTWGMTARVYGYEHTDESVERLLTAICNDHPELFFISANFTYKRYGDGLSVEFCYILSAEERLAAAIELEEAIASLLSDCRTDDPYETERNLHDALLTRCRYSYEAAESEALSDLHWRMSSPYAALCEGEAICGGYARAMQWLLARAEIDNMLVYNDDHVWNLVWLEDKPYFLDPTWNDFDDDIVSHRVFNVTYEDLIRTRTLPEVTPLHRSAVYFEENYFVREGDFIDGNWQTALTASLRRQLEEGKAWLEFRFSEDVFEEAVSYIESEAFFAEFDFLEEGAWTSFSYYTDDDLGIVTIKQTDA